MRTSIQLFAGLLIQAILTFPALGQGKEQNFHLNQLLQKKGLIIHNRHIGALSEQGKKAVKLDENAGEGLVWLKDVTFSSGTIEIDLRGQDVFQRSFLGIAFHGVDNETYDAIYFRPFNFQASDSVRKIHAVQYISHPVHTWKKLREEQNGQYEKAITPDGSPTPNPNEWFHARIEVDATTIKVYVNNAKAPALTVDKLNNRKSGSIGLWTGDGSGGSFANLTIRSR